VKAKRRVRGVGGRIKQTVQHNSEDKNENWKRCKEESSNNTKLKNKNAKKNK